MKRNHFFRRSEMENLVKSYSEWMKNESDPRVQSWLLMTSPFPTVAICASFSIFAIYLRVSMKKREPVNIRWFIWGFDFFHLATSSSLIVIIIKLNLLNDFNFR